MEALRRTFFVSALFASLSGFGVTTYTASVNGITWTYTITNGYASVGVGSSLSTAVPGSTSGVITIPSNLGGYTVTSIGDYAFYCCSGLTSVTIPDSVTRIGEFVFYNCSGLMSVTIPDSVTSIGDHAFNCCSGLTSVTIPDSVTSIGDHAFSGCVGLADADGFVIVCNILFDYVGAGGDVSIPDTVYDIGRGAFYGCGTITSLTIPDSVVNIGDGMFDGDYNQPRALRSVIIGHSVTNIGNYAFNNCHELYDITMSDSVTRIGNLAFSGCSSVLSVLIPPNVERIGDYAFAWCSNLQSVLFLGNAPCEMGDEVFSSTSCNIYVFENSTGWNIKIPGKWNGRQLKYMYEYIVDFNANGGTVEEASRRVLDIGGARLGDLPLPQLDGYRFVGWFTEEDGGVGVNANTVVRNDMTVYAHWVKTYKVVFDANGGVGGWSWDMDVGSDIVVPTVTRTGYTFKGWVPEVAATAPAEDVTYVAQWEINQYTVTFDANGGEGGTSCRQDYGTEIVVPTVTRTGYAFSRWSPSVPATVPAKDATYVAKWKANKFLVTFDANEGIGGTSDDLEFISGKVRSGLEVSHKRINKDTDEEFPVATAAEIAALPAGAYRLVATCAGSEVGEAAFDFTIQCNLNETYADHVTLTLNEVGTTPIENYTLLVRVSETLLPGFTYARAGDGTKIAFSGEDGVALSYDVDTWDAKGESLVWVKVPSAVNGTKVTFHWALKSGETAPENDSTKVWMDYAGVWHMGGGEDATAKSEAGAVAANASVTDSGMFGSAVKSTANGAPLLTAKASADVNSLTNGSFTISFWACLNGESDGTGLQYLFSRRENWGADQGYALRLATRTPSATSQQWGLACGRSDFMYTTLTGLLEGLAANRWMRHDVVFYTAEDGSAKNLYWYMDGELKKNMTLSATHGPFMNGTNDTAFAIGGRMGAITESLNGAMDEFRMRSGVVAAARMAVEYANQTFTDYLTATSGSGGGFLVPGVVTKDGVEVDYWMIEPSISQTYWDYGDGGAIAIDNGKLRSGSAITNWCVNLVTGWETNVVTAASLAALEPGSYRVYFKSLGTAAVADFGVDIVVSENVGSLDLGGTAGGRILLMNNDYTHGGTYSAPQISHQGWANTRTTAPTFWERLNTTAGSVNMMASTESILWKQGKGVGDKLWHLVECRHGNTFPSSGSGVTGLQSNQNYLPYSSKSLNIKNTLVSQTTPRAGVGQLVMRNTTDAVVYSPCYTNGIGTIYFDAVNGWNNNIWSFSGAPGDTNAYQVVVEVATATNDGRPPTDENSWTFFEEKVGEEVTITTNWYGNLNEECWTQCMIQRMRVRGGATISNETTEAKLELEVTEGGTMGEFYRICVPVNLEVPVRFRIRRISCDSGSLPDSNAFILIDNILVSPPPMTAELNPAGWYDTDKHNASVLGQEGAFPIPFPAVGDDVYARGVPKYHVSSWAEVGETNFIAAARMYYRWRCLNQKFDEWRSVVLDPKNDFAAVEPLVLPNETGDVEFYYVAQLQAPFYGYVDYSGLDIGIPWSERIFEVTNRLNSTIVLPSGGTDWFFRVRKDRSSNAVLRVHYRYDGSSSPMCSDLVLVGDGIWRGIVMAGSAERSVLSYRIESVSGRDDSYSRYTATTNYWLCNEEIGVFPSEACLVPGLADGWSELRGATGYIVFQVDDAGSGNGVMSLRTSIVDSLTSEDDYYALFNSSDLNSLSVPAAMQRIKDFAFYGYKSLTDVRFSSEVREIGEYAFYACGSLLNLVFEGNAPQVGDFAFGCSAKECCAYVSRDSSGWGVDIPGVWKGIAIDYIDHEIVYDACGGDGGARFLVEHGAALPVPDVTLQDFVFAGWYTDAVDGERVDVDKAISLADMTLCAHWELMPNTWLYDVVEGKVTITGHYAPTGDVEIPRRINGHPVTAIAEGAFAGCENLTGVTIPENVTYIGGRAFDGCTNLQRIELKGNAPKIDADTFLGVPSDCRIYVRYGSKGWGTAIPGEWGVGIADATEVMDVTGGMWYGYKVPGTSDDFICIITNTTWTASDGTATFVPKVDVAIKEVFVLGGGGGGGPGGGGGGGGGSLWIRKPVEYSAGETGVEIAVGKGGGGGNARYSNNLVRPGISSSGGNSWVRVKSAELHSVTNEYLGCGGSRGGTFTRASNSARAGAGSRTSGCTGGGSAIITAGFTVSDYFVNNRTCGLVDYAAGFGGAAVNGAPGGGGGGGLRGIGIDGDNSADEGNKGSVIYGGSDGEDGTGGVSGGTGGDGFPISVMGDSPIRTALGELLGDMNAWLGGGGGGGSGINTAANRAIWGVGANAPGNGGQGGGGRGGLYTAGSYGVNYQLGMGVDGKPFTGGGGGGGSFMNPVTNGSSTASNWILGGGKGADGLVVLLVQVKSDGGNGLTIDYVHHNVFLDANGGMCEANSISVAEGPIGDSLPDPTRTNATFLGWFTAAEGGDKIDGATLITGEMSLYAHWLTFDTAMDGVDEVVLSTPNDPPWTPVVYAFSKCGDSCARSGVIGDRASTSLSATVEGAGTMTFWCKTSCEHDEDNTFTWDRLMVYTNDVEIVEWRMDGETAWTERIVLFNSGTNTVKWVYCKDRVGAGGEDCAWVDGVVWTPSGVAGAIPEVAGDAGAAVVDAAVDGIGFADAVAVKEVIGGSAEGYKAFKTWADGVRGATGDALAGEAAVVANAHAAAAYLLGAERLFENAPKIEFEEVGIADGEDGGLGTSRPTMTVSVTVKDGEEAVKCAAEKVKAMFEATGDLGDWVGEAKLDPAVTVEEGEGATMRFKVTPGDGTAPKAFLRIRK